MRRDAMYVSIYVSDYEIITRQANVTEQGQEKTGQKGCRIQPKHQDKVRDFNKVLSIEGMPRRYATPFKK